MKRSTARRLPTIAFGPAVFAVAALAMAGCAGGAGTANTDTGEGFDYGAPQEDVDAVIADLEPVSLTYQPSAASPNSAVGIGALAFKDAVEERSGGKLEIELVWGQAIASYPEVDDALIDGRLDLATSVRIYDPSRFPAFNAHTTALSGLPISPVVGETINNSVTTETAWNNQALLDEFEADGIVPLNPMIATGATYTVCADEASDADDWDGKQIRVNSSAHLAIGQSIGASPVSMEYAEMFEALQRGTVDCAFGQLQTTSEAGLFEIAPYVYSTSDEAAFPGRAGATDLAGPNFSSLPIAYQQIVFDAMSVEKAAGDLEGLMETNLDGVEQIKAAGGEIRELGSETNEEIASTNEELLNETLEAGLLPDDFVDQKSASASHWAKKVEELGFSEGGGIEDFDEWYSASDFDFTGWAEIFYQEVAQEHRPS